MGIEKEEKPKKVFSITIDVYDSGDIDTSMVEYRKSPSGLGRPKAWQLTSNDFVRRVEEVLGDYDQFSEDWNKKIGKGAKQLLSFQMGSPTLQISTSPVEPKKEDTKTIKKEKNKETSKDEIDTEDIEFGEFDPDKKDNT